MGNDNVYVLIRTKIQSYSPYFEKEYYGYFKEALRSVLFQTYRNITVIILQDDWLKPYSKPRKMSCPEFCKDIISEAISERCTLSHTDVLFYSSNSRGAAHSLYNIRQIVMKESINDNDIVVMLDDDDVFSDKKVIENIVDKMNSGKAKVCISKFKIFGTTELNIVNKGGGNHNKLIETFNSKDSKPEELFKSGRVCFADSLGWTKAYRVSVLREYYDDLHRYFGSNKKMQDFFIKNDAFEDFPEIINLCRKNVPVVWLNECTHSYRKHKKSVTARTSKNDFMVERPIYLALLVGLFGTIKDKLIDESNTIIVRYCIVKMITIENILAKFKMQRYTFFRRWFMNLDNGAFIRILLSVFSKEKVLNTFMDMIKIYSPNIDTNKPNISIVEELCKEEAVKGYVDVVNCMQEKTYRFQVKRSLRKYEIYVGIALSFISLIIMVTLILFKDKDVMAVLMAGFVSLAGGIFTIYKTFKKDREEEDKQTKLFSDAVGELQRHFIANFNVLLEIKYQLEQPIENRAIFKPATVHLSNLKVSQQSFFMSDEMDKYIVVEEFKEISHLRVHIRNVNNSASFLEEFVRSAGYTEGKMKELVEWESARHLGLIIWVMFFNENKVFHFPNFEQMKIFVKNRDVIKYISELIPKDYKGNKDIESIYNYYCDDRQKCRKVLNMN